MPQVRHPLYQNIQLESPDTLIGKLQGLLTVTEYAQLPERLGMTSVWLGRKLSNPTSFKVAEARVLSEVMQIPVSDLALLYGVGLDEMTSGDILNILLEEGLLTPTAAAAAPVTANAEARGTVVCETPAP
jgi:alkanesulfonate monooxygenase SsuD/methylene tetrahydromethanopterin reductase-like flavin-dependent oxidoreductase (luciferase family)